MNAKSYRLFLILPQEIRRLIPTDPSELMRCLKDKDSIGPACVRLLQDTCDDLYAGNYLETRRNVEVLLDVMWEKLNTGHWKTVNITWRQGFSLASLLKTLTEFAISESGDESISMNDILKTCDVGLLMGAPIMGNILSDISSFLNKQISLLPGHYSKCETHGQPVKMSNYASHIKLDDEKLLETLSCPSLECFQKHHMNNHTPVILTDCVDFWPAMSSRKWTLEYLRNVAGNRTVPIELGSKYTDETWTQTLMTLNEFIDKYVDTSAVEGVGYLAQYQLFDQIPELLNDISVPSYCALGGLDDVDINAWFGPKGTVSPLHFDPKHNFLVQVVGQKYIRLYSNEISDRLYPHPGHLLENTSQVDVDNPDLEKFPLFEDTPYLECILSEGDMLYIPPKYWHYVKSLSISFSVSFWWD